MKNYHSEEVEFKSGEKVFHVTDTGEINPGRVLRESFPDCLQIAFDDGDEGTERAATCYHA